MFNNRTFKLHLHKLSDDRIAWVVQQFAACIGDQRDIYVLGAAPLAIS